MIVTALKTSAQIVNFILWCLGLIVVIMSVWLAWDYDMNSMADSMSDIFDHMISRFRDGSGISVFQINTDVIKCVQGKGKSVYFQRIRAFAKVCRFVCTHFNI